MADRILDLAEMTPRVLDLAAVERLFEDLAFETQVLSVALRAAEAAASPAEGASGPTLRAAKQALLSGEATGAQLRYVHAGTEWWDTVMRTSAGFRVVRVKRAPRAP
ncbi:MAG TPA: hypothetical protein VHE30_27985 [Polyangiaceae bacterium]|nr:hypothetical protein [Polyangiaceae bacterium]